MFDGQYAGTQWDSITAGGSCGKSRLEIDRISEFYECNHDIKWLTIQ